MDQYLVNLVTATANIPKLLRIDFQDASSYIRSVMFAAAVAMMNNSAMNSSCEK